MFRLPASRRRWRKFGAPLALLGFFGIIAGAGVVRSGVNELIDERTGCPASGHNSVTVVAVDSSDSLAPDNKAMVRQTVKNAAGDRRDSRVILVRIDGARKYRPEILFNRCNPGAAREARRWTEGTAARQAMFDESFLKPLETAIDGLSRRMPESEESYIADTIAHMVSDVALHLRHGERKLILLTDLLEHTQSSKPYRTGAVRLPEVREEFLAGIDLDLVELPAMKGASHLQTFETRTAWRNWCSTAGARACVMTAPGLGVAAAH